MYSGKGGRCTGLSRLARGPSVRLELLRFSVVWFMNVLLVTSTCQVWSEVASSAEEPLLLENIDVSYNIIQTCYWAGRILWSFAVILDHSIDNWWRICCEINTLTLLSSFSLSVVYSSNEGRGRFSTLLHWYCNLKHISITHQKKYVQCSGLPYHEL